MTPRIEVLTEKKLIGQRLTMSVKEDQTFTLFRSFMPRRKEIQGAVSTDVLCIQVYEKNLDFKEITVDTRFEKWASVEVKDFEHIPDEMEPFTIPGGLYAVFHYTGTSANFAPTFRYIFFDWLPKSGYLLDKRPHFEILGEKYKVNDDQSEEEIWLPVKHKANNRI